MSKSRAKAPDGLSWPLPWVAVATSEDRPWRFGAVDYEGDRLTDSQSPVVQAFGAPFGTLTCDLPTGGYWLLGPDGKGGYAPVDGWACIMRRGRGGASKSLLGSITAERDAFMAECERASRFRIKALFANVAVESFLGATGKVPVSAAMGALMSIATDHGVQVWMMPDDASAELAAAWVLRRAWMRWLADDASGERLRGVRDMLASTSARTEATT